MIKIDLENTKAFSVETEETDREETLETTRDAAKENEHVAVAADVEGMAADATGAVPADVAPRMGGLFGGDGGAGIAAIEDFATFDFGGAPGGGGRGFPGQEGLFQTTGGPGEATPEVEDKTADVVDYMTTNRVDGRAATGGLPQTTGDEGIDGFTHWLNTQTVRTEVEAELDGDEHRDVIDRLGDAEDEDPHADTPLMQAPPKPAGTEEGKEKKEDAAGTQEDEGGGENSGNGERTGGDDARNGQPKEPEKDDGNEPEEETGTGEGDPNEGEPDDTEEDSTGDESIPADPDGVIGGSPPEGAIDPEEGGETMPADPYGTPMPEIEPSEPGEGTTMPADPYAVEMVFVFDDPLEKVTMPADPYGADEPMPLPEPEAGTRFVAEAATGDTDAGFIGHETGAGFAEDFIV